MRTINEKFTDEEYATLLITKGTSGMNWHDFIIDATDKWTPHKDAGWTVEADE
jgi:hypothetical protein